MSQNINERLNWFLENQNLTASKLADKLGIQKSSISHIMSGRNKPSFDFLLRLKEAFPEINLDWFVTGKGEAFENNKQETSQATLFSQQEVLTETNNIEKTAGNTQTKHPVYKSKQDDVNSIVLIFEDDTYKILKPRK